MALNFPANPTVGQIYKVGTEQWVWNGTAWNIVPTPDAYAPVTIGQNPPTAGVLAGDLWWDSMNGRLYIYYSDATSAQWVAATQIPDPIVEVTSAQVVTAFNESLTPYVNGAAALAGGIPNGGLWRVTGATGSAAIRALIADSGAGVFTDLSVSNTITYGGTVITATGTEINYLDGVTSNVQTQLADLLAVDNNVYTLAGVSTNSTNLGTFTGSIIPDDSTIKAALQSLESAITADANVTALIAQSGMPAGSTNLGTFTGTLVPSASTTKDAVQALETPTENVITLTGQPVNSVNLGNFTGSVIPSSQTIKQALQALETNVETKAQASTVTALVALTGVPADSTNLGVFTGGLINDTATIKGALQVLETAVESAPHTVQGDPTQLQFNQAGQFAASPNLTFNTGTNVLFVNGVVQGDAANGETTVLKTSLAGVGYFSVTANGTLTNSGESTFKQRVTFQRTSSEAVVLRVSADNGGSFTPILTASGGISTPSTVSFSGLENYADDTAAANGGIAVGQLYRNGSVVMVRVS